MEQQTQKIILRSYPKAIFIYPLFLYTIIVMFLQFTDELWGYWSNLLGMNHANLCNWLSAFWLLLLFLCFFVISTEVQFSKFLAVGFLVVLAITFLAYIGAVNVWSILSGIGEQNLSLPIPFYLSVFGIFAFILGAMRLGTQFEYVKFERNEIWCMKGIMGKSKERFPTRSLEINVEKPDFFEAMLGTGRITIKIPSLNKFIQLDTVFRANKKVGKIDEHLDSIEFVDVSQSAQTS